MAKKPTPAPTAKTADDTQAGNKLKLILLIVGIVVVLLIGGGAAYYFLVMAPAAHSDTAEGSEAAVDEHATEEKHAEESAHPIEQIPVIYHSFKPITVNITAPGPVRFLRINITVMTRTAAVVAALDKHLPRIQNDLLTRLSGQNYTIISGQEGKNALREDLKKMLNDILTKSREPADIQDILFTDLVMQ
jgi:flagellar protein FliL